jgi:TolB-like protein/tRNA A-37 threonylcarbamoyl transferase component Bud32/Tfp pilus assembly protein PilF
VPDHLHDQLQATLGAAYRVERELGGGGMSRVFVAEETRFHRRVVVKVLAPELAAGLSAERFEREIVLAGGLQHPNIVPVITAGDVEGLPWYTMPFVEGDSLRKRLQRGRLADAEALRVLSDVASALTYAHAHGIVHRDIKPENVLLSAGVAVVTDFGIAKAVGVARTREGESSASATITEIGTSLGTPAYMAPEQAAGDAVDHRADLYAWGVVAYELLAGAHPFEGRTSARKHIAAHLMEIPPPLSQKRPDLSPGLAALVMSCLEKDPSARPQTAAALVERLGAINAQPRQPRRRMLVAAALAVAVAGAALVLRARDGAAPSAAQSSSVAAPIAGTPRYASSLAVLPLANYSRDSAQDYFADGMTDELTTTLSKLEALRVIANRSMLQFKRSERSAPEIARQLGVRYLVDGSVQQDGGRVRIRATLIDAQTNAPVWSDSFDRERRDILALQREVALAIAREIEITLTPQDRSRLADTLPVDPVAFDLYIKGTQARYKAVGEQDSREAMQYLERAIARDPKYAPSHAGLAALRALANDEAGARRSAETARALDPTLAEAPMVIGMIRQFFEADWAGSEAAFRQAIHLNPGNAETHHELSMLLLRLRRFDEALRESQLTVYLAPFTARFEEGLAEVYFFSSQYDEALVAAARALSRDSTYAAPYLLLASAYTQKGMFEKAEELLARCIPRSCAEGGPPLLGYVYAAAGKRAPARRILDSLTAQWELRRTKIGRADDIAQIYAGLGDRQRALDWLERSANEGSFMLYTGINPIFRTLHAEPRFRERLRKLRLPEPP